jgi:hypothetical protein
MNQALVIGANGHIGAGGAPLFRIDKANNELGYSPRSVR